MNVNLSDRIDNSQKIHPSQFELSNIFGLVLLITSITAGSFLIGQKYGQRATTSKLTSDRMESAQNQPLISPKPNSESDQRNWKTASLTINYKSEFIGNKQYSLEIKMPNDWEIQTYPLDTGSMIANCSEYQIASPTAGLTMFLQPHCNGWSAKTSIWPDTSTVVKQSTVNTNRGVATHFRLRNENSSNNIVYGDAIMDGDTLGPNPEIMDAVNIYFQPPDDKTNEYIFLPFKLTATYYLSADEKAKYLAVADQIAASIILK